MKTIWFREQYREGILSGTKTSTVRKVGVRPRLDVGEEINASVGPRPPFARLRVDRVERRTVEDFLPEKQRELASIYPQECDFLEINFKLLFKLGH